MLYIGLALAGLLPTAWVMHRRRDVALVATYFLAAAFVHTADWVASGGLGLYKYHPSLFADLVMDDAAGVFLAELIFVGTFAALLAALVPSWWGTLVGSGVVTVLEIIFHRIGALEYKGWVLWYTSAGFVVYFSLVRLYWRSIHRLTPWRGWPLVLLLVAVAVVFNGLLEIILWATKAVQFPVSLLPTKAENQAVLRFIWHATVGVPLGYWALCGRRPVPWGRILTAIAVSMLLNRLSVLVGFRVVRAPWHPEIIGLLQGLFFIPACLVAHWMEERAGHNTELFRE